MSENQIDKMVTVDINKEMKKDYIELCHECY